MEVERIQSPEGIRKLIQELWLQHRSGNKSCSGKMYLVDLPEPTEEEKQIMAANCAARKPVVLSEEQLQTLLNNASEKLGGW